MGSRKYEGLRHPSQHRDIQRISLSLFVFPCAFSCIFVCLRVSQCLSVSLYFLVFLCISLNFFEFLCPLCLVALVRVCSFIRVYYTCLF